MPDYQLGGVGVTVEPDFDGFAAEAGRKLDVIERELDPVEVRIVADLVKGFAKEAEAKAKKAMETVQVGVDLEPNMRGFKTEAQRLVKEISASVTGEIKLAPSLARGFKAELRAEIAKATADLSVVFEPKLAKNFKADLRAELLSATKGVKLVLEPELSKGFAKKIRADVALATKNVKPVVEVAPKLDPKFRSKLRSLVKAAGTSVDVSVTVNPEGVTEIQRKLREAVRLAAQGLRVRVSVDPEVGSFNQKLRAQVASLSVASRPRVSVGADTGPFATQLRAALAAAKTYAVVPVRVAMSGGASGLRGLKSVLDGTLQSAKLLGIGLGALAIGVGAVGIAGVKSAADFEYAQDAFKLLLEDATLGQEIFDGLLKASKETIFEVPDLSPVTRQLIVIRNTLGEENFGIDRILPSLTAITDLGAALDLTGPQIQRIGLALGKIAGRGKLTSEELRSISKNAPGFSAIGAIADKLGVSIPEAFDAVRKGGVDSKLAIDAILEGMTKFPGALGAGAREAQETFKGALSNLPDIARIAFFESFESELPRLTKLIGPDGPLVGAMEATLPAVARAFTPLAEQTLTMIQRLAEPIAAILLNMMPVISAVIGAVGDMAPAFTAIADSAAVALVPIAEAFRRLAQVITVVLVESLGEARPAFERLGEAGVEFLGYVGQIAATLAPLIPLLVEIATVIIQTVGQSALPVVAALSEGFEIAGPVLMDVVETIGLLVQEAAPLLTVFGEIVALVGSALVKAVREADLDSLADALGELAIAAAEIVVALTPLIPVAAEVVIILAQQLVPILEVMAPVITAVVVAVSPLLVLLARLAPLLLAVFAVAKVAAWGKAMADTFTMVTSSMGRVGERIFDAVTNVDWAGVGRKLIAGAAIATAGFSGMFAGAAEDATTQLTSIVAAGTSIATAFATGGPILGVISIAATAIGFFFGQAQKRAKEAAAEQKLYNDEVKGLRDAFDSAGVDRFSSQQAKAMVVTKAMLDTLKEGGQEAGYLTGAFETLGINFEAVALAAAKGEGSTKALREEIDRATGMKASLIASESVKGVDTFGKSTRFAVEAVDELGRSLAAEVGIMESAYVQYLSGTTNVKDLAAAYKEYGYDVGSAADLQDRFQQILQENLADSPAAQYIATLPQKTRDALVEQERLANVQRFITEEQDRTKGSTTLFAESYDRANASVSDATESYKKWLAALRGDKADLAQVNLSLIDFAEQRKAILEDDSLSPFQKDNEMAVLLANSSDLASEALVGFAQRSGGSFEVYKQQVDQFALPLIAELAESLKIPTAEAALLVEQMGLVATPEGFRVILDAGQAITDMGTLNSAVLDYILADPNKSLFLDTVQPEDRAAVLNQFISEYAASNPTAVSELNIDDPEIKEQMVAEILAKLDGKTVTTTIYMDIVQRRYEEGIASGSLETSIRNQERLRKNARGSVVRTPIISLVGEAGAEVILPLTDRARMAELLRQVGVDASVAEIAAGMASGGSVGALAGAGGGGDAPVATGGSSGASGTVIAWTVSNEGLDEWATATTLLFTTTTDSIELTLAAWQVSVQQIMDSLGASMTASWASTLGSMAGMANTGGMNIVGALQTTLDAGSSMVLTVVQGYSKNLASALNPLLTATGAKTIDVSQFRDGGINTPRIVPDGSYNVHVFGERGTHGEAYVPFDPALRSSSRSIAEETVRRLGGQAQWFRSGGVTGDTQGLNPAFHSRLDQFAGAVGTPFYVRSGYRSIAEQKVLYAKYLNGTGNLAAPPGASMHNFGLAADGPHWAGKHPELFGLTYPLLAKGEPWHTEIAGAKAIARGGLVPDTGSIPGMVPIPEVPVVPDRGELRRAAVAAMEYARKEALRWASSVSFAEPAGISDLIAAGIPVSVARALATIRAQESGGNYTVRNPDSTASGAYQFLNSSWAGFGGYPAAYLAPKAVQDAKAVQFLQGIMSRYPGILEAIPAAWFTGGYPGHGRMNYTPPGNRITVQAYVDKWLARYASLPGYENGGLTLREQTIRVSEKNKPELILPLTKPSRVRELADQHGLTQFLMEQERRRNDRPNMTVEVKAPSAERPETYAASLRNRLAPLLGS